MDFTNPTLLLGLTAIPLLILLSFWRLRPARVVVPSLELWKKIPERTPPVSSLRGPRFSLLLVAQMAAVAAGVIAAAGPSMRGEAEAPKTLILAVDRSPSMGTIVDRSTGRRRIDLAREEIRAILKGMNDYDTVILLADGEETVSRRMYPPEAARAIDDLALINHPFPAEEILSWIDVVRKDAPRSDALVVGDRDVGGDVRTLLVGGESDNAGIVAANVRETAPGTVDLFLAIFAAVEKEVAVRIAGPDGVERWTRSVKLTEGRNDVTFRGIAVGPLPAWNVALATPDNLSADDVVRIARRGTASLKVLSMGIESPFVVKALRAVGGGLVVHHTPVGDPASGYDCTIFNGVEPRMPKEGHVVVIDPPGSFDAGPFGRVEIGETGLGSGLLVAASGASLTDHVSLDGVEIPVVREVAGSGFREIFIARGKTVAALAETGERSMLVCAFPIDRGQPWVWKPVGSFAIFWTNYCRYVINTVRRNENLVVVGGLLQAEESDNRGKQKDAGALWGGPAGRDVVRQDLTMWLVALCGMTILASWLLERRMSRGQ